MASTKRLNLPLLAAAQAQKHVTVNDALMRLDGLANLVLASVTQTEPPAIVIDGACYGVPAGAGGEWAERGGRIAIGAGGGWVYAQPDAGARAFVSDCGMGAIHDGTQWRIGALTQGAGGAGMQAGLAQIDHAVSPGAVSITPPVIPSHAMVVGVSARVLEGLGAGVAGWSLGTQGATDRFGAGIGAAAGSWGRGMLSQPLTYWADTPLILTASGGGFEGGRVRLAVHYWAISVPEM